MEELTIEQVGQVLNLQPGTVRVRLHRARLCIRQEMSRIPKAAPGQPESAKLAKQKFNESASTRRSAASCFRISRIIWTAEWNRVPAARCTITSRRVRPAWRSFAIFAEPSTVAALLPGQRVLHGMRHENKMDLYLVT
jgi:hypothetical protein